MKVLESASDGKARLTLVIPKELKVRMDKRKEISGVPYIKQAMLALDLALRSWELEHPEAAA